MRAPSRRLVQALAILIVSGSGGLVGTAPAEAVTGADIVSTVAGNGTAGTPVEGPGTASPLSNPVDVSVAPSGTPWAGSAFFISAERVWRLSPLGELTRWAGGGEGFTEGELARDAELEGSLTAVDVAPDGQVYVST